MKTLRLLSSVSVVVAVGLSSLLFACGVETTDDEAVEPEPGIDESELVRRSFIIDADDDGKTVAVGQDQKFTIKLRASTGYDWSVDSAGGLGRPERRTSGAWEYLSWNVGDEIGSRKVELVYERSGASGPPSKRFEVTIDVKSALGKTCGGLASLRCNGGEYCQFTTSKCGKFDQMGRCEPRPERCPMIRMPVCGCNYRTYANECMAKAAGVDIAAEGACPE